ncbi:MAG: N-acetyl-gamma-glutamyl-phosphate reductase [Planctomycetota bacterium]
MKSVAIVGASGYTGQELQKLLARHPHLEAKLLMSSRDPSDATVSKAKSQLGQNHAGQVLIEPLNPERFGEVDGVFLCTPHGKASALVVAALAAGKPVVDLSADFRLRDPQLFQDTYGDAHAAPELLDRAVYGLTEHHRDEIRDATLVANPGCYPTSILLPLLPLLSHGLLDLTAPLIADSKSGVSGAGKQPSERSHYGNVHENFLAYGIGNHRHAPEIAQELGQPIVFTPHLLPIFRGILSTIYVRPAAGSNARAMRNCLMEQYSQEPFVSVYEHGSPELQNVRHSNDCHIAVHDSGPLVVITSAIDNLGKGASGQALQNMNVMLGLHEAEGLK